MNKIPNGFAGIPPSIDSLADACWRYANRTDGPQPKTWKRVQRWLDSKFQREQIALLNAEKLRPYFTRLS